MYVSSWSFSWNSWKELREASSRGRHLVAHKVPQGPRHGRGRRASPRDRRSTRRSTRRRWLVAANERCGKVCRGRWRPPTGASDSGWTRKASYGARRRLRGVAWARARTGGGRRNARRLSTEGAARPRARSLVEGRCALTAVVTPWASARRLQTITVSPETCG
jgi:hypothetical protein